MHRQRIKLHVNQGQTNSMEIKKESDRDVASLPYYLTYMEII